MYKRKLLFIVVSLFFFVTGADIVSFIDAPWITST